MALFSKSKRYERGEVNFDENNIAQSANDANAQARQLFAQAISTESKVKSGSKRIDDIYPITREETDEMEQLLNQAEAAIADRTDEPLVSAIADMKDVVAWSKKRHWNFSFLVILGSLVGLMFLKSNADDAKEELAEADALIETVEAWAEKDTTFVLSESLRGNYSQRYTSATAYKLYITGEEAARYFSSKRYAAEYSSYADTATTADRKQRYVELSNESEGYAAKYLALFSEYNKLNFDELHAKALEEVNDDSSDASSDAFWKGLYYWLFLLCIPLYVVAERPYGYTISRYRAEAKVLGGIRKVSYALAGGLLSLAGSIHFVEIVTKWSDGSETRSDDGSGPVRLGIKLLLVVAAVAVFAIVSSFVLVYCTIMGLIRNYNWAPVRSKAADMLGKAQQKMTEKAQK